MTNKIDIKLSYNNIDYTRAISEMKQKVENIINKKQNECLWLLEHNPVYTYGISTNPNEILNKYNIPIIKTERGGRATYHGPGQRIGYILINVKKHLNTDLHKYLRLIEDIIINTLNEFDILGERISGRTGIWVKTSAEYKKIATIGIRVRKFVTSHGFALNNTTNLEHFTGIIPCGITDAGITSLKDLNINVSTKNLDKIIQEQFFKKFKPC